MCPCYCCGNCTRWFLECISGTPVTAIPTSDFAVALLYGDEDFYETDEKLDNDNVEPAIDGVSDPAAASPTEKTELIRRKREQEFRMATLVRAEALKLENPEMEYFAHQRKQLLNGHGYNLGIFKGHVRGVREAFNPYSVLELSLASSNVGEVRIKGLETGLYLAMDSNGKLYAEPDPNNESTIFIENARGHYLTYLSKKYAHFGWYVGIKKTGRGKNGNKTWYPWGQKAIKFVARRPYAQPHPLMQITNRHGKTLIILSDGTVKGIMVKDHPEQRRAALLEFIPSIPPGAFRLRGVATNLYLAMDERGKLYGEPDFNSDFTLFAQHSHGQYFLFLSVKWAHLGWYVGLTKSGKPKNGSRTWFPPFQKAIEFVTKKQTVFSLPPKIAKTLDASNGNKNVTLTPVPPGTPNMVLPSTIKFIDEDEEEDGHQITKTKTVNRVLYDLSAV